MESYLLKSSISLVILYVLYQYLIKSGSNHQLNRLTGFVCITFSCGFLFIPIEGLSIPEVYSTTVYTVLQTSLDLQQGFSNARPSEVISIYSIVYIIGVGVFSLRSLIGLATLVSFYFKSDKYHRWGFTVVTVDKKLSPFTFFNILFIGTNDLNDEDMEAMIIHEQFHRDQLHSIDSLLLEVLTIIYWFNPVIWLFRRDIRNEHEYMADAQVLNRGIDALDYQKLLFKACTGTSMQLGNYFSNNLNLKKRYNMMNHIKIDSKKNYLRAVFFLPLMAIILTISSFVKVDLSHKPDKRAVYKQGMNTMYQTLSKNIKYPKSARDAGSEGIIYVSFLVNENGRAENVVAELRKGSLLKKIIVVANSTSISAKKSVPNDAMKDVAIRVIESLGEFIPAQKNGRPISSTLTLPIQFVLR